MRIAYLFHWNEGIESGVLKKIYSQVNCWRDEGHIVSVFQIIQKGKENNAFSSADWNLFTYNSFKTKFSAWKEAVKAIQSWYPDIVYHRYDLFYPALNKLAKLAPVVVEINTNDIFEYGYSSPRGLYNLLFRDFILKYVSGFVFVTHELQDSKHFRKYNKPSLVVGNGINLSDFPIVHSTEGSGNRIISAVFIGSEGQKWHGIDKIHHMSLKLPWNFHLIGISKKTDYIDFNNNVKLYGRMNRDEYHQILVNADIAIGTLALHRISMNEACPLKVREYLAYGLPTIIGYKDTDFIQDPPEFLLNIPNSEDNVNTNLDKIKEFALKWKGKKIKRDQIERIDIKYKARKILEFMSKLLN
jgi:hypothetical protein